jgi:hypothetical protein
LENRAILCRVGSLAGFRHTSRGPYAPCFKEPNTTSRLNLVTSRLLSGSARAGPKLPAAALEIAKSMTRLRHHVCMPLLRPANCLDGPVPTKLVVNASCARTNTGTIMHATTLGRLRNRRWSVHSADRHHLTHTAIGS